jgi:hypothetical protein
MLVQAGCADALAAVDDVVGVDVQDQLISGVFDASLASLWRREVDADIGRFVISSQ